MKKNTWLILISLLWIWVGCTNVTDSLKTASGIEIQYFQKGQPGDSLVTGDIALMHVHYRIEDGRDIIKTKPGEPLYVKYDRSLPPKYVGMVQEVFNVLTVGDSVYFELPAKNLWERSFNRPLPDSITAESKVLVNLSVKGQMNEGEYVEMMTKKEREINAAEYAREKEALTLYLSENNLSPTTTESGLMYIVTESTGGVQPEDGQTVSVKYKGMLLDGRVFDEGTHTFILGEGQVIPGWDEGIGYFALGEKGMLYIPSELGYGSRGAGPNIPPFTSLVFEIELIEIQ